MSEYLKSNFLCSELFVSNSQIYSVLRVSESRHTHFDEVSKGLRVRNIASQQKNLMRKRSRRDSSKVCYCDCLNYNIYSYVDTFLNIELHDRIHNSEITLDDASMQR